ncbi:hypothetical protein KSS87_023045 [Heliosperma pusillum]|nr:hypothetical protein KSS87_023045 [Heliosperma pusillum]
MVSLLSYFVACISCMLFRTSVNALHRTQPMAGKVKTRGTSRMLYVSKFGTKSGCLKQFSPSSLWLSCRKT